MRALQLPAAAHAAPSRASPRRPAPRAAARACALAARHAPPPPPLARRRRRLGCAQAGGGGAEPVSGDADGDEKPWMRDLTHKVIVPDAAEEERAAERERRSSRDFSRLFALLALVPYAAACMLLLSRVPELPDVLSITREQTIVFFVTLLVAELGLRCQRGVRLTLKALRRAEVEHAVSLEIGTRGDDGSEPRGCAEARLASARVRRYAGALAATAPLELAGAVLAALAPHPAPGVFAIVAAQLPVRSCAWVPGRGGVVRCVPRASRRGAALADAAAAAGAAAALLLRGAAASCGAAVLALAVVWQVAYSWDQEAPEGADELPPLAPLAAA